MLFATEPVDTWRGCLVFATDHKVRVKRARVPNGPDRVTNSTLCDCSRVDAGATEPAVPTSIPTSNDRERGMRTR